LALAVRQAAGLLEAPYARIWLLEADQLRCVAAVGSARPLIGNILPRTSLAGLALDGEVVRVDDATAHPRWSDRGLGERSGLRAYLAVPLRHRGAMLGVFTAMRRSRRPFDQTDALTLIGLATTTAAAVANARLVARTAEQEALLSAILEQLPSGVAVFDSGGRVALFNATAREILGEPPDESCSWQEFWAALSSRDVVTRQRLPVDELPTTRSLRGERVLGAELLIRRAEDGADRHVRASSVPLVRPDGTISGAVTVFTDVTRERVLDRDLAATALAHARLLGERHEQEQRLRTLSTGTPGQVPGPAEDEARAAVRALSPREREVLRLLAQGKDNREIAAALYLEPGTVKNHIGRLITKLGVADRTQAALLALRLGLPQTSTSD
ncbi:MAG: LuxR C-terminal-related transcriptional regulator, partial [Chloroflexota bacterium]|nr:LuxR C-terminal-related transcriptional regulator [Chloroflexota bacterium]